MIPKDTTQADPSIVALMHGIKVAEGTNGNYSIKGGSGENGIAQWMPNTWKIQAKSYLGDANAPMTPENQNKVLYSDIAAKKQSGLKPEEILSQWNSGKTDAYKNPNYKGVNSAGVAFDTPAYVQRAMTAAQQYAQQNRPPNSQVPQTTPSPTNQNSGALFPSNPNDTGLEAGAKTLGNLIPSAYRFAKGVVSSLNPVNAIKNIAQIPQAFNDLSQQSGGALNAIGAAAKEVPGTLYKGFVPEAGRNLLKGDLAGVQRSVTNDPVGSILPFLLAGEGVAKFADSNLGGLTKAAENNAANFANPDSPTYGKNIMPEQGVYQQGYNKAISTTAKIGLKAASPITVPLGAVAGLGGGILKSATSHLFGLDPESMTSIIKNHEAYSKLALDQVNRGGLANEFGSAIDKLEGTLQDTGEAYNPIRANKSNVAVPEDFIADVFGKKEYGLKIEDGKVIADSNSITRNTSDIKALQNFVDNWYSKTSLTPHEYLNMRKDIAGIAKFGKEIGVNKDAQTVGTDLYAQANKTIRPQIKGLKELDEQYSPIKQQFEQVKKDFLKKETDGSYTFKDGAVNKISNATGIGKESLLSRMEAILPGITKKIEVLETAEAIEKAYTNKVGNYTRAIIGATALTGNIPAIIAAIISNPKIAVPLLRGLGYTAAKVAPIVNTLRIFAGDLNNVALPKPVKDILLKEGISIVQGKVYNPKISDLSPELQAKALSMTKELPDPKAVEKPIILPNTKDTSGVKTVNAGKIINKVGDTVGYTSTEKGMRTKGVYSPYSEKIPSIQVGKKTKGKSSLSTIEY